MGGEGASEGNRAEGGLTAGTAVFALGLLAFVGSAATFVLDLATGFDVARSLAINGAAAFSLVAWAAHDTLADPDSGVQTLPGAVGTALLLLGGYLLVAAVVVALTSVLHGRLGLAVAVGVAGVAAAVVGFAVFPVEVFLDGSDGEGDEG